MSHTMFPSTTWFRALGRQMLLDAAVYRTLGPVECTMVVRIDASSGADLYEIVFHGYKMRSVRKLACIEDAAPGHFVLEASLQTWREMIENIRTNAGPDLTHTLNYLTFPDDPMRVTGPDQLEVDAFYRYNQTLQRFFNGSAAVPTVYAHEPHRREEHDHAP